jgi:hypothetical protein
VGVCPSKIGFETCCCVAAHQSRLTARLGHAAFDVKTKWHFSFSHLSGRSSLLAPYGRVFSKCKTVTKQTRQADLQSAHNVILM